MTREPGRAPPRIRFFEAVQFSSVTQSCPTLCDPMDCSPPASSIYGIFRQEYWSGLPFPSPGDLPDPGIEPASLMSPASAGRFLTTGPLGESECQILTASLKKIRRSQSTLVFFHANTHQISRQNGGPRAPASNHLCLQGRKSQGLKLKCYLTDRKSVV